MASLQLKRPNIELIPSYLAMVDESLPVASEQHTGYYLGSVERFLLARTSGAAFLQRIAGEERTKGLPLGMVPQTTFWLVRDGTEVIGESRLRHYLNPSLEIEGGHIGYFIRLSERRKGYGTQILTLTMEEARKLGLRRVMVTCNTENCGSTQVIRKNGGVFESEGISPRTGKLVSRYWIEL